MMTHPTEAELHDYFDDALDESVRVRVHVHVRECAACGGQVEAIAALRASARALPAGIEPPAELWGEVRALTIDARASRAAVLRSLRVPLAAAALVLVAAASVLTWWVTRTTSPVRVVVREAPAAAVHPSVVALRQAETDHLAATRTLLVLFEQRRAQMDPLVVAAVEHNLRIMNGAIEGAQAALASDPANQDVASILTTTYQSKVRMLRRAVSVTGDI